MTANDFSMKFRLQAPKFEYLISVGLSDIGAQRDIEGYNCISKGTNFECGDELLNLIANFDLRKVQIGTIRLNDTIQTDGDYYILGMEEADPLVMYKFNNEISVVDLADHQYVIHYCAENGDRFLDALIASREFIEKRASNPELELDSSTIRMKVEECAKIAGGEKYLSFYEYFIG